MRKIIDVPYLDQSVKYPTGCESVSAVMLLQYLGYEISVDTFIEKYLEKQPLEKKNGVLYGRIRENIFVEVLMMKRLLGVMHR